MNLFLIFFNFILLVFRVDYYFVLKDPLAAVNGSLAKDVWISADGTSAPAIYLKQVQLAQVLFYILLFSFLLFV